MGIDAFWLSDTQRCTCRAAEGEAHADGCLRRAWHLVHPRWAPGVRLADHVALPESPLDAVAIDAMLLLYQQIGMTTDGHHRTPRDIAASIGRFPQAALHQGVERVVVAFDYRQWRPPNKRVHVAAASGPEPFSADEMRDNGLRIDPLPLTPDGSTKPPDYYRSTHMAMATPLVDWNGQPLRYDNIALWQRGAWIERIDASSGRAVGFECYARHVAPPHFGAAQGGERWVRVRVGQTYLGYDVPLPPLDRVLATRDLREHLIVHLTTLLAEQPIGVAYSRTPEAAALRRPARLYIAGALFADADAADWRVLPCTLVKQQWEAGQRAGTFTERAADDAFAQWPSKTAAQHTAAPPASRLHPCPMGEADQRLVWYATRWANRGLAVMIWSNDSDMLPMLLLQQRDLLPPAPDPRGRGRSPLYQPRADIAWNAPPSALSALPGQTGQTGPAGQTGQTGPAGPAGPAGRRGVVWLNRRMVHVAPPPGTPDEALLDKRGQLPLCNVHELWEAMLCRALQTGDAGAGVGDWWRHVYNPVETYALLCVLGGKCDFCEGFYNIGPNKLLAALNAMLRPPEATAFLDLADLMGRLLDKPSTPRVRLVRYVMDANVRVALDAASSDGSVPWRRMLATLATVTTSRDVKAAVEQWAEERDVLEDECRRLAARAYEQQGRVALVEFEEENLGDPRVYHRVRVNEPAVERWLTRAIAAEVRGAGADTADASIEDLRTEALARWPDNDVRALRIVPPRHRLMARIRRAAWTLHYWLNGSKEAAPDPLATTPDGRSVWGWQRRSAPATEGAEGDVEPADFVA